MVGSLLVATPGSVHSTFIEFQLLIMVRSRVGIRIGIALDVVT